MSRPNSSIDNRQQNLPLAGARFFSSRTSLQFVIAAVAVLGCIGFAIVMIGSGIVRSPDDTSTIMIEQLQSDAIDGGFVARAIDSPTEVALESDEHEVLPVSFVANENVRIAEALGEALSAADLDGHTIAIAFQDGKVTITGEVTTEEVLEKVSTICSSVRGVQSVDNQLRCNPDVGKLPMTICP